MQRRLLVLGSTGSIGVQTLDVVAHLAREAAAGSGGPTFRVVGLAAGTRAEDLLAQARAHRVTDLALADDGADAAPHHADLDVRTGQGAATRLVEEVAEPGDVVMAAMVGAAGIAPVLAAIDRGCDVALANKETLVAAGPIVVERARAKGVRLLPVDSEHNAIAQCLRAGRHPDEVRRIVLTASGGPFRAWPAARLAGATVEQALDHPTWSMGPKVTVDSATLMNKAFEVIEARWLFDLPADRIDVVVHPQSIVHGMVEFDDGSVLAHLSPPDMRTPILSALCWPDRPAGGSDRLDLAALGRLEFEPVDHDRFPAIGLALDAVAAGGTAGAVLNAADEVAVAAFLDGRIGFPDIAGIVARTAAMIPSKDVRDLDDVLRADARAREVAGGLVADCAAPTREKAPGPTACS